MDIYLDKKLASSIIIEGKEFLTLSIILLKEKPIDYRKWALKAFLIYKLLKSKYRVPFILEKDYIYGDVRIFSERKYIKDKLMSSKNIRNFLLKYENKNEGGL